MSAAVKTKTPASSEMSVWGAFEGEVRARSGELDTLLPSHVSRDKFINTAIIAAKNNPDLVRCDRRSLHAAITKAAEDGLQPDGREGVINVYNEKRMIDGKESWVKVACWIPMTWGIRKRAREICGMIIDAQIVHENDSFTWSQGDDPSIDHKPTPLDGQPGKRIGAYAIFKQGNEIIHREVMRASQVNDVKSVVKAKNGLLWTKFEDEAWRKTVLRRGIKTVPSVPDALSRIISRDDDQYDLDGTAVAKLPAATAHAAIAVDIPEDEPQAAPLPSAAPPPSQPTDAQASDDTLPPDDDGWPGPPTNNQRR